VTLAFRNIEATPDDPVEQWGVEGIETAIERGSLRHWRRIAAAVLSDPWGKVAREVEETLAFSRPYGVSDLMERVVKLARTRASEGERHVVADEIRTLIASSGLSRREFAERIGTSASRLSTYESGKVVPSATIMVRMRRVSASTEKDRLASTGRLTPAGTSLDLPESGHLPDNQCTAPEIPSERRAEHFF
jgi:transcriptional regulator with XRE-family HTH domain